MNKGKVIMEVSQAKIEISLIFKAFFSRDPYQTELLVLSEVVYYKKLFKCVYASLSYIAARLGKERSYIGKIIRLWVACGFLELEERPHKTHIYKPTALAYVKDWYAYLLNLVVMPTLLSLSLLRADHDCPQLNYNNITCTGSSRATRLLTSNIPLKRERVSTVLQRNAHDSTPPWIYTQTFPSTPKMAPHEFDDIICQPRREHMALFTPQQLKALSIYSPSAIALAQQRLKEVTAKGNPPTDIFPWFEAICKSYTSKDIQEYTPTNDADRDFLQQRRERIKAKALSRGISIEGRTLNELQLMLNGYTVV